PVGGSLEFAPPRAPDNDWVLHIRGPSGRSGAGAIRGRRVARRVGPQGRPWCSTGSRATVAPGPHSGTRRVISPRTVRRAGRAVSHARRAASPYELTPCAIRARAKGSRCRRGGAVLGAEVSESGCAESDPRS